MCCQGLPCCLRHWQLQLLHQCQPWVLWLCCCRHLLSSSEVLQLWLLLLAELLLHCCLHSTQWLLLPSLCQGLQHCWQWRQHPLRQLLLQLWKLQRLSRVLLLLLLAALGLWLQYAGKGCQLRC